MPENLNLRPNQWQHVALTRSSNVMKAFVDGVQQLSFSAQQAADALSALGRAGISIGSAAPQDPIIKTKKVYVYVAPPGVHVRRIRQVRRRL